MQHSQHGFGKAGKFNHYLALICFYRIRLSFCNSSLPNWPFSIFHISSPKSSTFFTKFPHPEGPKRKRKRKRIDL